MARCVTRIYDGEDYYQPSKSEMREAADRFDNKTVVHHESQQREADLRLRLNLRDSFGKEWDE